MEKQLAQKALRKESLLDNTIVVTKEEDKKKTVSGTKKIPEDLKNATNIIEIEMLSENDEK
jgi:hypothetical protein